MPNKEARIDLDSADGRKPKPDREPLFASEGDWVEWIGGDSITGKWSVIFKGPSPFAESSFSGTRGTRDGGVAVRRGGFKYDIEHKDSDGHTKHDPIIVIRSSSSHTSEAEEIMAVARNIAVEAETLAQMVEGLFRSAEGLTSTADTGEAGAGEADGY